MIRLIEVNQDNWQECIKLPTLPEDAQFVAPNVYSIAEAQFYPKAKACCVYNDEGVMVGFVMYGPDEDDDALFWVDRLMIAEGQRDKGYGRAVLLAVLEEAQQRGFGLIGLSTKPENARAIHLYESLGFHATGEMTGHEAIYKRELP